MCVSTAGDWNRFFSLAPANCVTCKQDSTAGERAGVRGTSAQPLTLALSPNADSSVSPVFSGERERETVSPTLETHTQARRRTPIQGTRSMCQSPSSNESGRTFRISPRFKLGRVVQAPPVTIARRRIQKSWTRTQGLRVSDMIRRSWLARQVGCFKWTPGGLDSLGPIGGISNVTSPDRSARNSQRREPWLFGRLPVHFPKS